MFCAKKNVLLAQMTRNNDIAILSNMEGKNLSQIYAMSSRSDTSRLMKNKPVSRCIRIFY